MKKEIPIIIYEDEIEHTIVCSKCELTLARIFIDGHTILTNCPDFRWQKTKKNRGREYIEGKDGFRYYLVSRK